MHYDSSKNGDGSGFYTYEGRTVYVRSRTHTYGTVWRKKYMVNAWRMIDWIEQPSYAHSLFVKELGLVEVSVEVLKLEPKTLEGVTGFMEHIRKHTDAAVQELSQKQGEIRSSLTHWQALATEEDRGQRANSIPWPPQECKLVD